MKNRLRNIDLNVVVTEEEKELILNRMGAIDATNMRVFIKKMNMNLTRIQSNINQIAKKINSTDRYYKEDVR
ncbi:hypothetical protein [Senegalia massiliensis]|uniref:Plasmid mobilization relaxosome protein MobC n=1 Tax=Senegalia massiliensis TaxID=1720316 RepID=A0A845QUR5_9CLOT|nr:hypothetical protein [Senegalia massiliensis]NBI05246.1 plasmid mobilization relaxosome protein MobC [Senegalia massiliensis]